jgi:hypothetical protein
MLSDQAADSPPRRGMRWTIERLNAELACFEQIYELAMEICDRYGLPNLDSAGHCATAPAGDAAAHVDR